MDNPLSILIVAGEASGDIHGAELVREFKKIHKDARFYGIGGDGMTKEGVETSYHVRQMSFLGFFEVLKHLPFIKNVLKDLEAQLDQRRPDLVVLVDYPGFNLKFAQAVRKRGIPVVFFISPQVWAWRRGRVKKIARLVDLMLVIFPFEEEIYQKAGIPVRFVGHPLRDVVHSSLSKPEFFKGIGLNPKNPTIGLFPGSRHQEVERLLPEMIRSLGRLKGELPGLQAILAQAPTLDKVVYDSFLPKDDSVVVVQNKTYDAMKHVDVALVASGTATLETALIGTPMIILYKMAPISYWIGRMLVRLKNIGLANIVAGKTVVPELIQNQASPEKIVPKVLAYFKDDDYRSKVVGQLAVIAEKLGEPGAARHAAEAISDFFNMDDTQKERGSCS